MIGRRRLPGVRMAPQGATPPPLPETNPWWWNPGRVDAQFGPTHFRRELKAIDRDLEITWSPLHSRFLIWMRRPNLQHKICQGWSLLFPVNPTQLDARVFARLYSASQDKWGSAKRYFDAVVREVERIQEKKDAALNQDAIDRAMPYYEHSQIKVSMYGPSSGSKFATYHS